MQAHFSSVHCFNINHNEFLLNSSSYQFFHKWDFCGERRSQVCVLWTQLCRLGLGEFQDKISAAAKKGVEVRAARHGEHSLFGGLLSSLLYPVFSCRQCLLLKGNNRVLNQQTFPPRRLLGQLMAHAALSQVNGIKYMFIKRRINHSGYLWIKSYLLFFIPFLQFCLGGLSCSCNYHISLACGVSPLEHQSGWFFACAATTAGEVHNYLFFPQNKFARACF